MHFYYWDDCLSFAKEKRCFIYGVVTQKRERDVLSISCRDSSFEQNDGNALFIVGNKDHPISTEVLSYCNQLLHVDFRPSFTGKIDCDAVLGICLHSYCSSIKKSAQQYAEGKYPILINGIETVDDENNKVDYVVTNSIKALKEIRSEKHLKNNSSDFTDNFTYSLFVDNES
jgi:hypothetical protein